MFYMVILEIIKLKWPMRPIRWKMKYKKYLFLCIRIEQKIGTFSDVNYTKCNTLVI